jgi:hypothetical protein
MINNINCVIWIYLCSEISIQKSFSLAAFNSNLISLRSSQFSIGNKDGSRIFISLSVKSLSFF